MIGKIQRRQLYKSSLRKSILDSALQIIEKEGYSAVTIRKIAHAIEYSVPTIYEYFKNKESLLTELKKEWLGKMLELIQGIHADEKEPVAALEKIALAYTKYSLENPAHYKAVMSRETPEGDFVEIHTLRSILKDWIHGVTKSDRGLDDKVDMLRSYLHGVVALFLLKKMRGGEDRCIKLIKEGVDALTKSWKS
ncbi:MAG: TetR/AcrR family transcriptional regulator [Anaerolineae bacterium]